MTMHLAHVLMEWVDSLQRQLYFLVKILPAHYIFAYIGQSKYWFLRYLGRKTKQPKSKITFQRVGFCVPQVSINCLASPKGAKYNRISNKQAVSILSNKMSMHRLCYTFTSLLVLENRNPSVKIIKATEQY